MRYWIIDISLIIFTMGVAIWLLVIPLIKFVRRKRRAATQNYIEETPAFRVRGGEIRRYPPQKRTIKIKNRYYCLQFPWLVFARTGSVLHVGMMRKRSKKVYCIPLPNINRYYVCQSDEGKVFDTFDKMIANFWVSGFNDWIGTPNDLAFKVWFEHRFNYWKTLSLDGILKILSKNKNENLYVDYDDFRRSYT